MLAKFDRDGKFAGLATQENLSLEISWNQTSDKLPSMMCIPCRPVQAVGTFRALGPVSAPTRTGGLSAWPGANSTVARGQPANRETMCSRCEVALPKGRFAFPSLFPALVAADQGSSVIQGCILPCTAAGCAIFQYGVLRKFCILSRVPVR